jgi:hypothetical protein
VRGGALGGPNPKCRETERSRRPCSAPAPKGKSLGGLTPRPVYICASLRGCFVRFRPSNHGHVPPRLMVRLGVIMVKSTGADSQRIDPDALLDCLVSAFSRSGIAEFRTFLAKHPGVTKWFIASDFVNADPQAASDVYAFTFFPYEGILSNLKQKLGNWSERFQEDNRR